MLRQKLNLKMDHFETTGLVLTPEEQIILRTSLPLLQMENAFTSVKLLGKVFGIKNDYYIAQGRSKDYIRNKINFYSFDGEFWYMLFPPSQKDVPKFHLFRGAFEGDPFKLHYYVNYKEEDDYPDKRQFMKEDRRLSVFLKFLDYETATVPKGALMITPQGLIEKNDWFRGLSKGELTNLENYLHERLPLFDTVFQPTSLLCPVEGDKTLDFLEPLSTDDPQCWSVQTDGPCEVVTLRNNWWPGFSFYNIAEINEYNSLYIGNGIRNDDFPFMV